MTGSKRWRAAIPALVLAGGCAQLPGPSPEPATEPGTLGALDASYDRAKWRWVKNPDGRALLSHTDLKCFVDPQPDQDFNDPGFTVKREEKTIGNTRYEIMNLFENREFWEAIYIRPGSKAPLLGVYATGKCQDEAERILENYEKRRP